MPNPDLVRVNCIHCDKRVGLRRDQLGRRVRCPSCKRTFQVDRPAEPGGPIYVGPEATPESESPGAWEPVDDANEMVRVVRPQAPPPPGPPSPTSKAKLSATFQRRQALVYQTAVRAVRECGCEIVELDKSNHHLRFSMQLPGGQVTEHDLYVFDEAGGACEMDIISREPNEDGQAELCYQAIVREMGKFLLYASDGETTVPEPAMQPPTIPLDLGDDWELTGAIRRRRATARRRRFYIVGLTVGLIALIVAGGLMISRYNGGSAPDVPDSTRPLVGHWVRVWPTAGDITEEIEFHKNGMALFSGRGGKGRASIDFTGEFPYSYDPQFNRITIGPIIGPEGPKLIHISVQQLSTAELVIEFDGQKQVYHRK